MQTQISFIALLSQADGAQQPDILFKCFAVLFLFAFIWIVGVTTVSMISRLRKGKPIFRPRFPNARFLERWRSGRSFGSFMARYGGAENCLWVAVTDGELRVGPHFPFNLAFMPDRFGLEFRIPGIDILSVEHKPLSFGGHTVLIHFRNATGTEETIEITVRDVEAFDRAIGEIRNENVPT